MKKRILLLLLFVAHTFGNLFNDYMSNLKLENYSEEDRYAIKPFLENMYTVKEKNFQEIRKKFYQTRTETIDWKFRKNLDEESGNTDKLMKLDGTFPMAEDGKPLRISADLYITKSQSGKIFLVNDGKFEELFILNFWTKSATGCSCKFGSETNCACCHRGGCVCSYEVGTCVQCGLENDASKCSKKDLELGSVFGFSKSTLSQIILIMVQEKSLLFFEYNLESKYLLEVSHEGKPMTIDLPNKIENVFYEEILTFGLDGLGKRRFLFVISELGASNSCYEIIIDSDQETFYLRKILDFSLKGRNIKVFNMHGKIFIGYITKDEMFHLEQFKVNDENAILNQFLQLNNYKVETWDYLEGSRCYILLKEGDYERVLLFDEATQSLIFHQNILAKSVQKILPVTVPKGKSTELLIFISNGILDFYVLDHNKFESVNTHKFDEKYVLSRTSTFTFNDTLYLLMTSASGSDLYRIFLTEGEENVDYSGETLKKFQELKELFDYQITSLESLEQELEDFLSYKKKNLAKEMSKDTFDSIQLSLESLEHNINLVKKSLETAEVFLEDVVPKLGTKKVISGTKHFYGPKTTIRELVVEFARTGGSKNEESIFEIVQNLVQINDETPIKGRKTFLGKSEVKDLHTKTLNGVDMENFMTVNKPVEIEKATYTNGIKVKEDILSFSTVFGIDLSEDLVGLEGHHKLGSCSFKDLRTLDGIEIQSDLVNSEYFKDFTGSLLTLNKDITFEGSVAFSQMIVKGNLNSNYLMKIDTNDLLSQVILKDKNETLSVATFEAPLLCKELESKRINNEIFPEEFVIESGSWIDFGSDKYFDNINFKKLSVEGYVDTLRTKDLVTKSTSQDVSGSKIFEKGVRILGDLNILSNLIGGVDLHLFMKIPDDIGETSIITFEEEVTAPGVIVKGKVNNLNLEEVANDLVYKSESESVITGRKDFLRDLIVKNDLTSKSVNQIDFDNFVNTEERTIFTAQKTFTKTVNFKDLKVNGLIDNVNITELFDNSVFLDKPYQFVPGKKVFQSLSTNILNIEESINGRPIANLLTKTTDQTFPDNLILDQVSFDTLLTEKVFLYKNATLNEISVNDIRQKLEMEGNFDDSLIVVGDVYVAQELRAEKLNGRKTKDLYDLLLRNEKLQLLNRDIIFDDLNIYGSVKTSDLTAGNATILKRKAAFALRTLEKNFISEYMIWDSIEAESVNVMGLVNKFKLYDLVEDSVFATDPSTVFVKGPKHFLNGFHVDGDLESDSINGIDLRRNLFSRTEFQVIYDNAHFEHMNHQNVFISSFNGIDISRFSYAQKREKIVINEPLTFKGFVHVSSLKLGQGYLGGINGKRVLDDAVDLRAGKIIISGKKTFVQPPTFTNLNVVRLNNELLPKLSKNFNDMVFDYIVVNGTLMVTKVKTKNLVTKNQKSLLSPSHLRSEFLLTDKVLNPLIFEDLIVYGNISSSRVNGYILEDDFLTKTTNQSLWSRFNILSMLTRDVFVEGLVNGFKIPDGSIIQESTKVISASVVQNESLHIPGSLFVKGQFGSRKIKISDLVILTEDSHFNGLLSFHASLVTTFIKAVDEDSTLNDMTLSTLDARLRSFRQLLSLQNISKSVNSSNSFLEAMKNTWNSECLKTKMLQHSLSKAFVEPHSFVLSSVQQFEIPNPTRFFDQPTESNEKSAPVLIFKAASKHWMINSLHFGSCKTKLLKWSKTKSSFVVIESIGNVVGNFVSWIKLESPEFEKVFLLAVGSSEGKCENKGSSLWSFDLNTLKMERIQELKSAVNAIAIKIDRSYVYWNYGHHNSLMSFSDGRLELTWPDGNFLPEIKLSKVFMKPGGGRLIISYFDDILDIVDDSERRGIFLPNVVGIEIVRTSHNEIIFLVSKLKFGLTGESHLLEAYLYERRNLLFISSLPLESSSLILNLETPKYDYDHAMIFALSANHPRILILGGFPFIKTWRDFPSKLTNSLWAYDFIDSDNNFYLCYGDQSQIYTIRLERQGIKYYGQYVNCT